ncbi:MAG: hypothetical protein OIF50_17640 [Flavobacteriaceae bacterium]|nr:hypothetical protein [Flavobacteriaceae bacterium]
METSHHQIPKKDQRMYFLDLSAFQPYEIYLNDILIGEDTSGASDLVDLRPWLLKNGTYTVKLKFIKHPYNDHLEFDLPGYLRFLQFVENEEGDMDKSTMKTIDLPIYYPKTPVREYQQEWQIKITDLPYTLEGWQNGRDLSKINNKILHQRVLHYYTEIRNVLNLGSSSRWQKISSIKATETSVFLYQTNVEFNDKLNKNKKKIEDFAKGNMIPIENYSLKIYGKNNQLVSLERNETNFRTKGVLRTKEPSGDSRVYNIKLYLPKGSNEFVIIRK